MRMKLFSFDKILVGKKQQDSSLFEAFVFLMHVCGQLCSNAGHISGVDKVVFWAIKLVAPLELLGSDGGSFFYRRNP